MHEFTDFCAETTNALPREKVSAPSTFSAPVPILVAFTRQKTEVPCSKFWERVPIFRGAVPKTLVV